MEGFEYRNPYAARVAPVVANDLLCDITVVND